MTAGGVPPAMELGWLEIRADQFSQGREDKPASPGGRRSFAQPVPCRGRTPSGIAVGL